MTLIPVDSTSVQQIGYDEGTQTLHVEFRNGSAYQYFDVPLPVFQEMTNAESKGQYINQVIKGSYRFARL